MTRKKKWALLGALIVGGALGFAPGAFAHHATVTATLDCNGQISYTVSSWEKKTSDHGGVNNAVVLKDSLGNTFPSPPGQFNDANDYQFSGTFTISTSVTTDTLTPFTGTWGDGETGGLYTSYATTVTRPSNCGSLTTNASAPATAPASLHDTAHLAGVAAGATGTLTFRLYSDSSCAHAVSGSPVQTTGINGPGDYDSPSITVTSPGTYYWTVSYGGDSMNPAIPTTACDAPNESTVVSKASPNLVTSASAGGTLGVPVTDQATLSGGSSPTGTITFKLWGPAATPTCTNLVFASDAITVDGNGNYTSAPGFTPAAAGTYYWTASYTGDANNKAASGACGAAYESVVITPKTPSTPVLVTHASAGGTVGTSVTDQATLSGGSSPTGTIRFELWGPAATPTCTNNLVFVSDAITVDGNGNYTSAPGFTPTAAGTYYWTANYVGDANNDAASGACGAANESVVITPKIPTPSTPVLVTQASAGGAVGTSVTDQATLSGGSSPTGTITFKLYGPASAPVCTNLVFTSSAVTVSGNGNYTSTPAYTPTAVGTYYWVAGYSGDANNSAISATCGAANESVTITGGGGGGSGGGGGGTPSIAIVKNPKSQSIASGATANFTITVTNTGQLTLQNVIVNDPLAPNCNQSPASISALGSMSPGASVTYNCSLGNVTQSLTNTASVTGLASNGDTVTASDTAPVTVTPLTAPPPPPPTPSKVHPAISILKDPNSQTIAKGGTATFKIAVTNSGDTTLSDVKVTDPRSPGCNRSLGTLGVGQSKSYTCTRKHVTADFRNVATATGKPPAHPVVRAADHADVKTHHAVVKAHHAVVKAHHAVVKAHHAAVKAAPSAPPKNPQIAIVKSPKSQTLTTSITTTSSAKGTTSTAVHYATAKFTIKVTNKGNVKLHNVIVSDPLSTQCSRTIGFLAPGASSGYSCQRPAVPASFTNVATVTGTAPDGKKVSAVDDARVVVEVKTSASSGAQFTG